jgi:hypothetical protein
MSIEDVLGSIVTTLNEQIRRYQVKTPSDNPEAWPNFLYSYNNVTNDVSIEYQVAEPMDYTFTVRLVSADPDFFKVMNYNGDRSAMLGEKTKWEFHNVWNRKDLFIHASFVNYSSFNYLGRNGEFYQKPSKIYDFAHQPIGFYFQISFDGMHFTELYYENFIVELCMILDSKKYQGE